ncbi:MAG: hypothetical protein K940chlam9_00468 [Chlamydiae bacterium]|nr:hypothetical protein [Chlamydiota bacterium]
MDDAISYQVIGAAIEVHRHLGGPGLLKKIYESALVHELKLRNIEFKNQVPISVQYKGEMIQEPMYIDLVVENQLIIELKATEKNHSVYQSQLLTYLR